MEATLTIQEVAAETGLSEHTLRYYEKIGLINPVRRAANGHRRYTVNDVGWIQFLNRLRTTGMPITQMQQYAELQRQGDSTIGARLELLRAHRETVLAQLAELNENLAVIEYKIDWYSGEYNKQLAELTMPPLIEPAL
ncbi:MAG: MerR family transcriptional regulator [Anaerolineae bacterium]|nr:MerR family transcriptional regulator [Anaerolineae bacterium]